MDGSFHLWLEERGGKVCLMHMVDDAIVTMSFNRLFLGGLLSSRARLRFTGFGYSATQFLVCKIGWEPTFQPKGDTSNVVK